ncbi:MAG: Gfo/Idh/MocA family protein [Gaiellaceae bacterium]
MLGSVVGDPTPVVGLASRVPPAAQYLLVHESLLFTAGGDPHETFRSFVSALSTHRDFIAKSTRQTYLYSDDAPPAELVSLVASCATAGPVGTDAAIEPAIVPPPVRSASRETMLVRRPRRPGGGPPPLALLGAGDYARTQILPALRRPAVALAVVADREPQVGAAIAEEAGFDAVTTSAIEAIEHLERPGIVLIATYHDSHANLAAAALDAGHRVFVEKPPAVTPADVDLLVRAVEEGGRGIDVGFNRRHHPFAEQSRALLAAETGPFTITCLVREVSIEPDHWYLWPNQGTRVTGNLCHWIDLAVFLMGSHALPETVQASPPLTDAPERRDEERVVSVTFDDGSLLTVVATGRGDDILGVQETIEARRGRLTLAIDDFRSLRTVRAGARRTSRRLWRDKGHSRMFADVLNRLAAGRPGAYPTRDLVLVSAIQIAASRAALLGESDLDPAAYARSRLEQLGGHVEPPVPVP